jgi:hypothetical protein
MSGRCADPPARKPAIAHHPVKPANKKPPAQGNYGHAAARITGRLNGSPNALISVEPMADSASGLFHHLNSMLLCFFGHDFA